MPVIEKVIEKVRLDRSRHAAPQVFEKLREAIVALDLVPGTVLARAELAEQFGISQTPIRDALLKLGEEGLVDIFPQHATVVSRIDISADSRERSCARAVTTLDLSNCSIKRGATRAIMRPIIAKTIINSTKVKPFSRFERVFFIFVLPNLSIHWAKP